MTAPKWDTRPVSSQSPSYHPVVEHSTDAFPPEWAGSPGPSRPQWYQRPAARWAAVAAGALLLIALAGWSSPHAMTRQTKSSYSLDWALPAFNATEKTVVLYAYFETELSRPNAEFFIRHALHDSADFVFIVNGPAQLRFPDHLPNVRVVQRDNSCYDLGSHGEVLEANDRALVKKYDKFILMNASVRGPFLPHWSRECWSSAFTNMVTDKVKLAGLTMNCIEGVTEVDWLGIKVGDPSVVSLRHLQAMLLATDRTGLALLLVPAGLSACHDEYIAAIDTEIRLSSLIRAAGFKLDAAMSLFQDADDFSDACTAPNPFDAYPGGMLHPHELMFVKSRAGTPDDVIERYTHFARGYDSHRFCRAR